MFSTIRLKLTGLYLGIIMCVSLGFSLIIFVGITSTARQAVADHNGRVFRRFSQEGYFPRLPQPPFSFDVDTVNEIKERTVFHLLLINLLVFLVSGSLGYLLAGRTLAPIEEMIEKQKDFIANASHEIKTPLTAMKTELEVGLRDKKMTLDDAKKIMASVGEDVDFLHKLTLSLLDRSKYQDGYLSKEIEKVSIKDVLEVCLVRCDKLIKGKKIELITKLENAFVTGNKESLITLFGNLIDNSIKFSNHGGVVAISVSLDSKNVYVEISDSGVGIAKDDLPNIFDPFYKGEKSRTKKNDDGFGLGLSIAWDIAKAHKGSIKAESILGKGAKFTVVLPLIA